ncbi:MAG: zinc metalloprotease [Ignavibacteriae bacterium]|nr:zinc metalloprotease [Ignavibacteriota bacterium]
MTIDYKIIFTERKSVNIIIDRNSKIIVRAPKRLTRDDVAKVVNSKKHWIYNKLSNSSKPITSPKEFVSGESLLYLGEHYKLRILDEQFSGLRFDNEFTISKSNKSKTKEIFKAWYLAQAKKKFLPIVDYYSDTLGVKYNRIYIKSMKASWGSCSPNKSITLNWKLVKAPLYVINYIIVHELAHLIELNHSEDFWNIVSVQVPNYKKAKKWLTQHGELLELEL